MEYLYINIREAEDRDLPAIMQVEHLCFNDSWKKEDILYEMHENPVANFWVIELSHDAENKTARVVGFSDYWQTFESATICQIAIHPYLQHRQLGTALMDEIYNDCYAKKVTSLTLEVRASNQQAINFYEKYGFKKEVIKPHYYKDGEDAHYMILEVK